MVSKTKRQPVDPRIPRSYNLLQATFNALKVLGGSGSNEEILGQIIKDLGITDEVASISHKGNPNFTELAYQVAWARTYLNQYGVIENSGRSRWSIREEYRETDKIDEELIMKTVIAKSNTKQEKGEKNSTENNINNHNKNRTFLFKKNVDKSLLKAGLTIPKDSYSTLLEAVQLVLPKGEKASINIFVEGNSYKVSLTNVNFDENITNREVLQIRYSEGSAICKKLKEIFSYSLAKIANNEGESLNEESVDIYALGPSALEFVCFPKVLNEDKSGGEKVVTVKDTIQNVKKYIAAKGFSYEEGLIENFYLSLKSKPFVILAGTSGTGKTRLVKLFAEAIGANSANGRYQMVSVRPDWSDSTDLFGHVDLNGRFIPGTIIDFVKRAELDTNHPYVLCLDEMNLARVEYYLSDFLSVMETRDLNAQGNIISAPLISTNYYGMDKNAEGKYGTVKLPDNFYIVGTVNMDETTFPFSKKVLDRANTIEFSYVDLMPQETVLDNIPAMDLPNSFLKTQYLFLQQCREETDAIQGYCTVLKNINEILQSANVHVGYRIRDEIVFYMLNNKETNLLPENTAFDNELMQKILPRIQGSSASIKNMLCELFKFCAGDYEGYQTETEDVSSKMLKVAQNPECKYKNSAKKIAFMVRRFEEDGFTSYWL